MRSSGYWIAAALLCAMGLHSSLAWSDPSQAPLFLTGTARPMVMLSLSIDHQLFKKAYPDYNDLNGDGIPDTSYTDTFTYYGYFDSSRCYTYSSNRFEPGGLATGTNGHSCTATGGYTKANGWSGNFLNWATMTRIDILRKVLYGGLRSTDNASETVLQRTLLTTDVHAFAKVYAGTDIGNFTPFTSSAISVCNATLSSDSNSATTNTSSYPPKMLVASGSYPRWASDEVHQCQWGSSTGQTPSTSNNLMSSGSSDGLNVLVHVCVSGTEESNCTAYGSGTVKKPTGLLQQYGQDGTVRFGMVSGDYQKHASGGVLRRTVGQLAGNSTASQNEINSNGTFTGNPGIIDTLNRATLNQYNFGGHVYNDCNTYGISKSDFLHSTDSGRQCTDWGNPVAEIYMETLRYLAQPDGSGTTSATSAFDTTSSDLLNRDKAAWDDPMPNDDEWCAPMNVIIISSSDNSFDTDELSNTPSVLGDAATDTDEIGTAEGLSGNVFIGDNGSTPTSASDYDVCSAKAFTSLSRLKGICPTAPYIEGGYDVAGLAYKAHITDIRPDRPNDPDTGAGQTVSTYVVALSKELPQLTFPVGTNRKIQVIPNVGANNTGSAALTDSGWRVGTLTDLFVRQMTVNGSGQLTYARVLATWEDSPWGNDYDKDGITQLAICVGTAECHQHDDDGDGRWDDVYGPTSSPLTVGANQVRVTNRVVDAYAGNALRFGFSVSGSTADGTYTNVLRPGGQNGTVLDSSNNPTGLRPSGTTWSSPDVKVFSPGASSATLLPNPLFYAAKYGGFKDQDSSGDTGYQLPDKPAEWDSDNDGVPDNFFYADNPSQLGPELSKFLATIAAISSASSVVANTVSLDTGTRVYQARFDSTDWSGQVLSFRVDPNTGNFLDNTNSLVSPANATSSDAEWDVGAKLAAQNYNTGRQIITWGTDPNDPNAPAVGVPFRWSSLSAGQQALLNANPTSPTLASDGLGSFRLNYLRGDSSKEQRHSGSFRNRSTPLGAIIHSTPALVAAPSFTYPDSLESVLYSTFKTTYQNRETMIYFGSSDGMLHGASAAPARDQYGSPISGSDGGEEKIAYVPNAVFGSLSGSTVLSAPLSALTSPSYTHRYMVDGAPTVVDAFFGGAWHTVLVGSLAAGGSAIFALDVTDPNQFTEAHAGSLALWELSSSSSGFSDLGYTFSRPAVFKAQGDGWVAAFGNGYNSASGKAVVYLVDVRTGAVVKTLTLDNGPGNGASTLAPVDTDADGLVDLIYVGDLQGNLWRLKAGSGGGGFTSAGISRLFAAKASSTQHQYITSRPEVGVHPLGSPGRMVYFGTGKYYELTDSDPNNAVSPNTVYGIWDKDDGSQVASVTNHSASSSTLVKQTVTNDVTYTASGVSTEVRVVSDNTIDWTTQRGWFLDLPTTGESVVDAPILRGGRLIFTTAIPSTAPCEAGGTSWLMELDAATGGALQRPVFDLNNDGSFDVADYATVTSSSGTTSTKIPSGVKSKQGILQRPAILSSPSGEQEYKYASGTKGGGLQKVTENPSPLERGRKAWWQVQ